MCATTTYSMLKHVGGEKQLRRSLKETHARTQPVTYNNNSSSRGCCRGARGMSAVAQPSKGALLEAVTPLPGSQDGPGVRGGKSL